MNNVLDWPSSLSRIQTDNNVGRQYETCDSLNKKKQAEVKNNVSGLVLFRRLAGEPKSVALDYCLAGIINSAVQPSSE